MPGLSFQQVMKDGILTVTMVAATMSMEAGEMKRCADQMRQLNWFKVWGQFESRFKKDVHGKLDVEQAEAWLRVFCIIVSHVSGYWDDIHGGYWDEYGRYWEEGWGGYWNTDGTYYVCLSCMMWELVRQQTAPQSPLLKQVFAVRLQRCQGKTMQMRAPDGRTLSSHVYGQMFGCRVCGLRQMVADECLSIDHSMQNCCSYISYLMFRGRLKMLLGLFLGFSFGVYIPAVFCMQLPGLVQAMWPDSNSSFNCGNTPCSQWSLLGLWQALLGDAWFFFVLCPWGSGTLWFMMCRQTLDINKDLIYFNNNTIYLV